MSKRLNGKQEPGSKSIDKLIRHIRYLDKLIDELAKGKPMEKIMRK